MMITNGYSVCKLIELVQKLNRITFTYIELEPDSRLTWEASFRLARVLGLSKAFGFRLVSYTDLLNTMIAICNKYNCFRDNKENRHVHLL